MQIQAKHNKPTGEYKGKPAWYDMQAKGKHGDVYIYSEIGFWGITAKQFVKDLTELGEVNKITVHINSMGGAVGDGIAIYNTLKKHKAQVTVEIDGYALSMGSVIAMCGDHIVMADNALMMIHNPWGIALGDADELRKAAEISDKHKTVLVRSYAKQTSLGEDVISDYMNEETWFTADEALENGFVDEIGDAVDLNNSLAQHPQDLLNRFGALKNVPEHFLQLSATAGTLRGDSTMLKKGKGKVSGTKKADGTDEKTTVTGSDTPVKPGRDLGAEALLADKNRREAIAGVFSAFQNQSDLMRACQDDYGCSEQDARDRLLVALGNQDAGTIGSNPVVTVGETAVEKFNKAATTALAFRGGLEIDEKDADYAGELKGYTLVEMARKSLEINGVNTSRMDKMELVGAAFTHSSSDFPILLEQTARTSLLKGFNEVDEVFDRISRTVNLSDFKTTKSAGLSQFTDLDKIGENGEYKYGTFSEKEREGLTLATYGKLFSISRQAIINDELDAFVAIPSRMGKAAKRKVSNLVWGIFSSHKMADGKELFLAARNNLIIGGALDVAHLGKGKQAMGSHKDDVSKQSYRITPFGLLVPNALEDQALTLMASKFDPDSDKPNAPNPYQGRYEVIAEPRLDDISPKDWYMFANPQLQDVIGVGYLDGNSEPFLDQQEGWNVDGVEFKVRIDATAKALEHRTMVKVKGA